MLQIISAAAVKQLLAVQQDAMSAFSGEKESC